MITSQPPSAIRKYVERIADHLDLEYLKKISGVCVSDPDGMVQTSLVGASSEAEEGDDGMVLSPDASSPSELGGFRLDMSIL